MIEPNPLNHVLTSVSLLTYLCILATASITFYRFSVPRTNESYLPYTTQYFTDIKLILLGFVMGVLSLTIVLGLQLITTILPIEAEWPTIPVIRLFYFTGMLAIIFMHINLLILLIRGKPSLVKTE